MIRNYYSNGKLLLSGEYLVLRGASSLVVPLKVGQQMKVIATGYEEKPVIRWQANVMEEPWFFAVISVSDWKILKTNEDVVAGNLVKLLTEAGNLNPMLFDPKTGYEIITETHFDHNWGFGSSSALIANVAQWSMIDPFELYFSLSEGSGADVAAAISDGPVLYRLIDRTPYYCRVDFHPPFFRNLWLIYTGNKQNSSESVSRFQSKSSVPNKTIRLIDKITLELIQMDSLKGFMKLIADHERILSELLEIPPVKEQFRDFQGEIKSLGAWGGDFILAVTEMNEESVREYFRQREMYTIFTFDQIVLQ